jgi:hypothetical protein
MEPALGLEGTRSTGQQAQPFLVLDHLANGDSSFRCQLRVRWSPLCFAALPELLIDLCTRWTLIYKPLASPCGARPCPSIPRSQQSGVQEDTRWVSTQWGQLEIEYVYVALAGLELSFFEQVGLKLTRIIWLCYLLSAEIKWVYHCTWLTLFIHLSSNLCVCVLNTVLLCSPRLFLNLYLFLPQFPQSWDLLSLKNTY